jgi:hypothetical protein
MENQRAKAGRVRTTFLQFRNRPRPAGGGLLLVQRLRRCVLDWRVD